MRLDIVLIIDFMTNYLDELLNEFIDLVYEITKFLNETILNRL